jgi:histidine ammonia-lyase
MLRERPDAPELLEAAREALLAELLPALPPERQLAARMAANAMAIAARAVRQAPWEAALLAHVPDGSLAAFAAAIRAGRHDPGTPGHAAALSWLREATRRRCEVSAPRALG